MNNEGGVGSAAAAAAPPAAGADTFSTVSMILFSGDTVGGRPAELPLGEQLQLLLSVSVAVSVAGL